MKESILNSQPNFRDLGGIRTKSGQKIKENRIFRSGSFGKLDENDLSVLKGLGIGNIVDLRTSEEIELLDTENHPKTIEYYNVAINAGNISTSLIPIFEKGEFGLIDSNVMNKIYFEVITTFKSELALVYRAILNADTGIIYHCSQGKDRTGIISALLLDFFDVERDYIYMDYLKSNELLKRQNEYYIQLIKENFSKQFNREVSDEEFAPVKSLFYVREENLKGVFDYIDSESLSANNYFRFELGLTEAELELLKSKYLE